MPKATIKKVIVKKIGDGNRKPKMPVASPECCFWVSSGMIIKDLKDLEGALNKMTDATYAYHAGGNKNDFAKWVGEVLSSKNLAAELFKCRNRKEALAAVSAHLKKYY